MSERLVKDDVYTSVHLEEFESETRDTKLALKKLLVKFQTLVKMLLKTLDEMGIIRIGAEVKEGDILVGKVTPKGEKTFLLKNVSFTLSLETSLVKCGILLFGCLTGGRGVVRDVKIFTRANGDELQSGVEAAHEKRTKTPTTSLSRYAWSG